MLKKLSVIGVVVLCLSGCTDKGPWNGFWGLKSGVTTEQLSEILKITKLPKDAFTTPKGVYVETSPSVPKSDVVVFDKYVYWFSKNGLISVSGAFTGADALRELHEIKLKYGNFELNSRRNETLGVFSGYTLTSDNAKLDDGITAIDVDVLNNDMLTVRIVYKGYPDIGKLLKSFHAGEIQAN